MEPAYDHRLIEDTWQRRWDEGKIYATGIRPDRASRFVVDMFPYPSGESMHVGHPRGYVATDVYSRFKRMGGFNVLHPMGWDAFGLPAEETAIANREYPAISVARNIAKFKRQLRRLGLSYDWDREINTTDPKFYRQTQRIFLEMFRRGLAYNAVSNVNWCPALGTVLANEDIVDGRSERGNHPVLQQPMRQWALRITAYASRLVDDLDRLPMWPEKVKNAQRSWIGKSHGHELSFETTSAQRISIFTTRLETLAGATFIGISPEAELLPRLLALASNRADVEAYIGASRSGTDRDRRAVRDKTGKIIEGVAAINPVSGEPIPIVVADYVLASYGSGAVMGVPGHDERDHELAKALSLRIETVIEGDRLVNSGRYDGLTIDEACRRMSGELRAVPKTQFKMRDWVFSRQRFWGEPFPIVWIRGQDDYERLARGPVGEWLPEEPVAYEEDRSRFFAVPIIPAHLDCAQLPVVEAYEPTGSPSGPLAAMSGWVNASIDPATGAIFPADASTDFISCMRETNTMPQWAGSSWYWLRYMDPDNAEEPFSRRSADLWGPVNLYAGADHAVAHLIYARFWHKVLFDAGMVSFAEPFERLEFLGYVLASDGTKISKRKGNGRNPDEVFDAVGVDALRVYEMAIGPFEKAAPWKDDNLNGMRRFLDRVWRFARRAILAPADRSHPDVALKINKTVEKVSNDIESFKFNTAISAMMIFLNGCERLPVSPHDLGIFVRLLAPFAPHLAEEIWAHLGQPFSIHQAEWPLSDAVAMQVSVVRLPVQINGKKRAEIDVPVDADEASVRALAMADPVVADWLANSSIKRLIYVPRRIISISI